MIEHYKDCVTKTADGENQEPLIDAKNTRREWQVLKKLVYESHYRTDSMKSLWQLLHSDHADAFPNLAMLASIALSVQFQFHFVPPEIWRRGTCDPLEKKLPPGI